MGLKSDKWIQKMADRHGMIEPFEGGLIRHNRSGQPVLSFGTSSYGYDVRCTDEFKVFTNINPATIIDPKSFDPASCVDLRAPFCVVPPNGFVLARSLEYFRIPDDVLVVCLGKSTYARCGLIVNTTPLEPGWEGHITLEFSNTAPLPIKVYANEGVAQLLFFQGDEPCTTNYRARAGKYQGQKGITPPR